VTATSFQLQEFKGWNTPKTRVFSLVLPPTNRFWWNEVTSGWLPFTSGQVMSFPVTWLSLPVSYSPVGAETHPNFGLQPSTAFTRPLPVKWHLSGHFRSLAAMFHHFVTRLVPPVSYSPIAAETTQNASCRSSRALFRALLVKRCHFLVTSSHFRHDVISCHVTGNSCELQPCRSWNAPKTQVVGLLQPSPGYFWYDLPSR